jgi:ACR3 family arsenite efflux pump ArsB
MNVYRPAGFGYKFLNDIFSVPGLIALLVTITICFLYISKIVADKPPEILSAAFTLILGFYFGSKVAK